MRAPRRNPIEQPAVVCGSGLLPWRAGTIPARDALMAWRNAEFFGHVAQCAPHPDISVPVGSTWFRHASRRAAGTSRGGARNGSSAHGRSTHGRSADGSATHGGAAYGGTPASFRRTAYGRDTTCRFAALRGTARVSSAAPLRRPPCCAAFCFTSRRFASRRSSPLVRACPERTRWTASGRARIGADASHGCGACNAAAESPRPVCCARIETVRGRFPDGPGRD